MKPRRTNQKRIKNKVFAKFMVFASLLIAFLWIFQIVLLESFYKQIKTNSLINTADTLGQHIALLDKVDFQSLQSLVSDASVKNEISIKVIESTTTETTEVFDTVFSILAQHDNILSRLRRSELYFLYEMAKDNGGSKIQTYQRGSYTIFAPLSEMPENEDNDTFFAPKQSYAHGAPSFFQQGITQELLYALVVPRNDGKEYMLICNSVITPIGTTIKTLQYVLAFQSIIILLIATFSANALAKKISRPITEMTKSANLLAAGNYDVVFNGSGYKEATELADTLNYATNELKQSDNVKRELIANTSHDLRTPLTMIIGYAEVMRDLPGENMPENVQVIIDEAERLTTLVNDMLDLSRLQSKDVKLEKTEFNLTELTEQIVERMRKLTEKDGFVFNISKTKNAFVFADETKITQVIYNFLSNAVNYSGNSRTIEINQTISANKVRLEFVDHGIGIEKEKLPSIWDRYYKIDGTHKRSQVGSGIGLSIVKSILELHKAKYGVTSKLDFGSTFWFELNTTDII